ncbi:hypothetical protein JCM8547_003473 [Rhodosporidiobolus lusitaniae]
MLSLLLSVSLYFTLSSLCAALVHPVKALSRSLLHAVEPSYSSRLERALSQSPATLLTPQQAVYLHRVLSSTVVVEKSSLNLPLLNSPREDESVLVELKSATVKQADTVIVETMFVPSLVVVKHSITSTTSSDDDEDFLSSPPLSPTFSDSSSIPSPPPSPLFERDVSLTAINEEDEDEEKRPVVETVRSSAYPVKVSILNDWLVEPSSSVSLPSLVALEAARQHGLTYIASEERYEIRYDAWRGKAQGADEDERKRHWEVRISRCMEDYIRLLDVSPENRPSLFRKGPPPPPTAIQFVFKTDLLALSDSFRPTSRPSLYASSADSPSPDLTFVDLSLVRRTLDLPLPRQQPPRRAYSVREQGLDEDHLYQSVLTSEAHKVEQQQNLEMFAAWEREQALALEAAQSHASDVQVQGEDEVDVIRVVNPSSLSSPPSSATSTFSWADEDEGDDAFFFAVPPGWADEEKEGAKDDVTDLFSVATPFSSASSTSSSPSVLSPVPYPPSSPVSPASSTRWSDEDEDDEAFFSSPPSWD